MADTRPERRFTRIDRLPPYVFNITAELKMAARRRGEDIIDFSMGNPDGATPPHIVENYVLWPSARTRMVTPLHAAFRGYVAPFPTGIRIATMLKSTRNQKPSSRSVRKEGLAHLMLATLDLMVTRCWCRIQVTRSKIDGAVIAGAQVRSVPLVEGVDLQRTGASHS